MSSYTMSDPGLTNLAQAVVRTMRARGFKVATGPGEYELVYLEGCDVRGNKIPRRRDRWDDVRVMITHVGGFGGSPRVAGIWEATTRPGWYYDRDHVLPDARAMGAAIVDLGQQEDCWQLGLHRGKYRAWVQTGGPVTIVRDKNQNLERDPADARTTGYYGINHHHGDDHDDSSIGPESAGCCVVRVRREHEESIRLADSDPRQRADSAHKWRATFMPREWLDVHPGDIPVQPAAPPARRDGFFSMTPNGFYSNKPFDASAGPVSVRMNNPGAVNGAKWEESYPGFVTTRETTPGNRTTVFQSPEHGVAVWWDLMRRYRSLGSTTVGQIIRRYGGGQDYSAYVATVTRWTGLAATQEIKIDGSDDATLLAFARGMFRYESGLTKLPWSDAQITRGFQFAREFSSTGKTSYPQNKPGSPGRAAGGGVGLGGGGAVGAAAAHWDLNWWTIVALAAGVLLIAASVLAGVRQYREHKLLGNVQPGTGGAS